MTRDVTCSMTLLGRKKYEETMSDEHPSKDSIREMLTVTIYESFILFYFILFYF